jgi:hypothetical protein
MHARKMHAREVQRRTPMRDTPREIRAREVHTHETHTYQIHAREIHAHETPAHQMHARGMHAREVRSDFRKWFCGFGRGTWVGTDVSPSCRRVCCQLGCSRVIPEAEMCPPSGQGALHIRSKALTGKEEAYGYGGATGRPRLTTYRAT